MNRGTGRVGRIAVGAAMLVLAIAACGDDSESDAPIEGGEALGGGAASDCLVYDEATLLAQEVAFDGTLVAASGDQATFQVHEWYRGGEGAEIVLGAGGLLAEEAQALVGTSLQVGERYLISATDGFVWACGYSLTYDTDIAAEWTELFGS